MAPSGCVRGLPRRPRATAVDPFRGACPPRQREVDDARADTSGGSPGRSVGRHESGAVSASVAQDRRLLSRSTPCRYCPLATCRSRATRSSGRPRRETPGRRPTLSRPWLSSTPAELRTVTTRHRDSSSSWSDSWGRPRRSGQRQSADAGCAYDPEPPMPEVGESPTASTRSEMPSSSTHTASHSRLHRWSPLEP